MRLEMTRDVGRGGSLHVRVSFLDIDFGKRSLQQELCDDSRITLLLSLFFWGSYFVGWLCKLRFALLCWHSYMARLGHGEMSRNSRSAATFKLDSVDIGPMFFFSCAAIGVCLWELCESSSLWESVRSYLWFESTG